jgi:hypothetical protein
VPLKLETAEGLKFWGSRFDGAGFAGFAMNNKHKVTSFTFTVTDWTIFFAFSFDFSFQYYLREARIEPCSGSDYRWYP